MEGSIKENHGLIKTSLPPENFLQVVVDIDVSDIGGGNAWIYPKFPKILYDCTPQYSSSHAQHKFKDPKNFTALT